MLHRLSFANFYSFKDEVAIDFVVDKHAPDTDAYFTDDAGNRSSKIMTIVGANASGKTNLLKSLVFLKWFIVESFSELEPDERINTNENFKQFFFCENNAPSTFEIVFAIDKEIFKYNLQITGKRVLNENLAVKGNSNRWSSVFARSYKEENQTYTFAFQKLDLPSDFDKLVRENTSVLSAAKQINNSFALKITNYFSNIQSNIEEEASSKNPFREIFNTAEFYEKNASIRNKVEKILQRFDLGISAFSIKTFKGADKELYIPFAVHRQSDSENVEELMIMEESSGTRNLFLLLKDIFSALETGNIVVFDELDNNLHPLMVPEIVNLFRSKVHNPKNAQLIFTSHNLQILSQLDKQQILIVEKNENVSEAWKLSDIDGVRADENYYAKYLAGVYGGIPRF